MHYVNTEEEPTTVDTTLYHQHASRIFAYVYRLVPSREDAEDIVLEVFLAAYRQGNLTELPSGRQQAWLQQVAKNKAIDHYRRSLHLTLAPLEQAAHIVTGEQTPEHQALQREAIAQLYATLSRLSSVEQQVVRLRFGNGLRFKEIAEVLDKTEGSVRALLSRTLLRLRSIYLEAEERK